MPKQKITLSIDSEIVQRLRIESMEKYGHTKAVSKLIEDLTRKEDDLAEKENELARKEQKIEEEKEKERMKKFEESQKILHAAQAAKREEIEEQLEKQ